MAKMVQMTISVTERQAVAIRNEARRRDIGEGEQIRNVLDFWLDAVGGRAAICGTVLATPIAKPAA